MRPFLDQDIQFLSGMYASGRFKTRITFGASAVGGFDTLHTLRSPSAVWVASMSDFCLDEDACQVSVTIGDGARDVVRVCRMVKLGCNAANKMEPLLYLRQCEDDVTWERIERTLWHMSCSRTTAQWP